MCRGAAPTGVSVGPPCCIGFEKNRPDRQRKEAARGPAPNLFASFPEKKEGLMAFVRWWSGSGRSDRTRWLSQTTGSCTGWWTSTRPARRRGSSPSSAVRSMWPQGAGPGSRRSTSSTPPSTTWSCCAGMRRATAISPTWSLRRSWRAFTSSPASTWTCCGSTAAA